LKNKGTAEITEKYDSFTLISYFEDESGKNFKGVLWINVSQFPCMLLPTFIFKVRDKCKAIVFLLNVCLKLKQIIIKQPKRSESMRAT
jgi:hypothetical protein